ncbi:hypothetical protein [Novosphingobium rosa]|uniref:hypothetical protein n=1 Tax=Novosphingobium rosa TaxID=76978 RepID=UPI00082DA08B|nr:hypothetical protein [Novosphingobium rosa]
MSLFDSLLGQLGSNVDVGGIAQRFGIDPATAQTAIAALGQAHQEPGDTVDTAAANTGIDPSVLSGIAEHLGGEGALGQIAQHLSDNPQMLQSVMGMFGGQQGEGAQGGLGGLLGAASGFFGGGSAAKE